MYKNKIVVPLFGAAYAAPNKGTTILYCFRTPKTVLNPPVNGKIQGLFKTYECFSSTVQGRLNLRTLQDSSVYSSTYQACANPVLWIGDGREINVSINYKRVKQSVENENHRKPDDQKQSGPFFVSPQLILQFTEGIQWFNYRVGYTFPRIKRGSNIFHGGGGGGGGGGPNANFCRNPHDL